MTYVFEKFEVRKKVDARDMDRNLVEVWGLINVEYKCVFGFRFFERPRGSPYLEIRPDESPGIIRVPVVSLLISTGHAFITFECLGMVFDLDYFTPLQFYCTDHTRMSEALRLLQEMDFEKLRKIVVEIPKRFSANLIGTLEVA